MDVTILKLHNTAGRMEFDAFADPFYLNYFHATLRSYDQNIKSNQNAYTNRSVDTGGYSFVYPWRKFMWFFFPFCSFFLPNVFLLTLIRCLGDVGSSGFWKWNEGSKNLLHFVPCSSYNGLLTALCPVPSLLNPVHFMKCWVFPLLLLLFILLLLSLLTHWFHHLPSHWSATSPGHW